LYFEAHSGRSLYFEAPSGSFYFEDEDELHSEACSDSFRYQEEEEDELLDEEGGGDEEAAVVAGATAATTSTDSQPQSRGQSFRARIQAALRAQFLFSEAAATSNLTKNHNHHHNNDNKDLARRSSSLSRLPESKNSVSIYRRSMSETSSSSLQVVDDHVSSTLQNQHEWDCEELLFTAAAAHQGKKKKNMKEASSSTEGDHTAISIIPPASSMKLSSSKRYTLNWLMGRHRDRRLVYSAATPPPCPQDLQQQQQHPLADCSDCHLQIAVAATASC
jgi:hypothetical protein